MQLFLANKISVRLLFSVKQMHVVVLLGLGFPLGASILTE